MVSYLLDTNACISLLRGTHPQIADKIHAVGIQNCSICSIVKAELLYGARKSVNPVRHLEVLSDFFCGFSSFYFDDRCADIYGVLRSNLAKNGEIIGPNDLIIASIAIANDAILVTHNTREFSRVSSLRLEDWEEIQ